MKLSKNQIYKRILILAFIFIHSFGNAISTNDELTLIDAGRSIENKIEIFVSDAEYRTIKAVDGHKVSPKKAIAIVNGDSITVKDIHTRGNTSLYFRRKSFSFNLDSKATFIHGDRTITMKKFDAIGLSMDKSYIRNRLAFELMEEIQLFDLFYSFCEIRINGQSEGIYMIIERPQDWAMKKKNSPLVIRRGYNHNIDKIKTGKKIDKPEAKNYKNYYKQIYKSLHKYEGEELYEVLSRWLDMEMYMKWLAFNFFVRNGDYTDEVYFCIDPVVDKFNIIPWDYDDIFAAAPHEGLEEKIKNIGGKLIFSSEDLLDQKIATDPYFYEKYLIQLNKVLTQLSASTLKNVFENTYSDLYPYYSNGEIIGMSQYDLYKNATIETLQADLDNLFNQLKVSRISLLRYLKNEIEK